MNQADFCPSDPAVVCVTGDRILRFFRVVDAQFKPLPLNLKMELQVYTAHCWLADEQVGKLIDLWPALQAMAHWNAGISDMALGYVHVRLSLNNVT